MTNEVSKFLSELRRDHRNMALMLDLLEQESNRIYKGESADFDLMHDILLYMTVYPDAVHHPKEDKIYAELKAARPDLSTGMARITKEHRELGEQSTTLRKTIEGVISGEILTRKDVVAEVLRYVNSLRDHMRWEESDLFHRIDEMIRDGHDEIDEAVLDHVTDPVFGPTVELRFARLFESIKAAATAV